MTNLKTITAEKLEEIRNALLDKWVDDIQIDDLINYYREGTEEFLSNSTPEQILEWAEEHDIKV